MQARRIINGEKTLKPGEKSLELLSHFWCRFCKKWWSIGDAPKSRQEWHCPWCGIKNKYR